MEAQRIQTPHNDLNKLLGGGLRRGQLIAISGHTAVGKSILGLGIASRAAEDGHRVLMFNLESPVEEIVTRFIAATFQFPLSRLRRAEVNRDELSDSEWQQLRAGKDEFGYLNDHFRIVSPSRGARHCTVEALRRQLTAMKETGAPAEIVILDYLQLLLSDQQMVPLDDAELAGMTRELKALALEFEIPIVVISHLNRDHELRESEVPHLSHLDNVGTITVDADVVIIVHRDDLATPGTSRDGQADLIVAKHKGGPTGTVTVAHELHYARFIDISRESSDEPTGTPARTEPWVNTRRNPDKPATTTLDEEFQRLLGRLGAGELDDLPVPSEYETAAKIVLSDISELAGKLIVTAGTRGVGKTAVLMTMARYTSSILQYPTLYISMECPEEEIRSRLLAGLAGVSVNRVRRWDLSAREQADLAQAQEKMAAAMDLSVICRPRISLDLLKATVETFIARGVRPVVFVDNLQALITSERERQAEREAERKRLYGSDGYEGGSPDPRIDYPADDVLRQLKLLSSRLAMPVVATSWLSTSWAELRQRSDQRPTRMDVIEEVEQWADWVVLLHRDSVRAGEMHVHARSREMVEFDWRATVTFQGHYARIVDMASG